MAERKAKEEKKLPQVVGEYELQEKAGQGSYAAVFRAAHLPTGALVAVKEIDTGRVDARTHDEMMQEIEVLAGFSHPNILRLLDSFETGGNLYLVLEYCDGGDLDAYLVARERLPEATARELVRQLAEGLKVLRGKNIVHRDLKLQNLLLSTNGDAVTLKIGDFGFARPVHENLAATFCGSPYYMAPEIWRHEKYDAKADLWSVGVILFRLVTGKYPFNGRDRFELGQNILTSNGLNFPPDFEADVYPDLTDLCKRLLCLDQNMRMSFEEFLNHSFLATARKREIIRESSHLVYLRDACQTTSSDVLKVKSENVDSNNFKVYDSWEWIERDYVLVHMNTTSTEMLSSLEKSGKDGKGARPANYDRFTAKGSVQNQNRDLLCRVGTVKTHGCTTLSISHELTAAEEDLPGRRPDYFTRLCVLKQYLVVLSELAQEKISKRLDLDALSLELLMLAIWKEALNACSLYMDASDGNPSTFAHENFMHESDCHPSSDVAQGLDFTRPTSFCSWAESGFIKAYDRAEKISHRLQRNNDNNMMPDATEIIFQTALVNGKAGAANELLGYQNRSMGLYSKAIILLTFVSEEAATLPLNPPFSLSPFNKQRIHKYIANLRSHLCRVQLNVQQRLQS